MNPLAVRKYRKQPELAIVELLYMLSRFPYVGCAAMAVSIQRHFDWLSQDQRVPPVVRRAALDLASQWSEMLVACAQPAPAGAEPAGMSVRADPGGPGSH